MVATDPDRAARLIADAERIAQSITDEVDKARGLAIVAKAMATTDPDRAVQLVADAERIARTTMDDIFATWVLANVAEAMAAIDPDRVERMAESLVGDGWRSGHW
jgi:hypothetical protein